MRYTNAPVRWLSVVTAAVATFAASDSSADVRPHRNFPVKPVRLLLGPAAGSSPDVVVRMFANTLGELWGQPVVVENRPGAGNTIAPAVAAKAPPDGYTLLICPISDAIAPALHKTLPYDLIRDFSAITLIGTTPNVLVVHPSVPANTVGEFIAYAQKNPGKLHYGSTGVGTTPHLSMEWLKTIRSIQAVHVSYRGSTVPALIGGEIQVAFQNLPGQLDHIRAGRTRALGVTAAKRASQIPDIPTIAESGLPGYEVVVWYGLCAPVAAPRHLIATINSNVVDVLKTSELQKRMQNHGVDIAASTPEQFSAFIRSETAKWAKVVRDAGIPPQ